MIARTTADILDELLELSAQAKSACRRLSNR